MLPFALPSDKNEPKHIPAVRAFHEICYLQGLLYLLEEDFDTPACTKQCFFIRTDSESDDLRACLFLLVRCYDAASESRSANCFLQDVNWFVHFATR